MFLFNFELGNLQGPFKALTTCSDRIVHEAWRNKFPYQVKVQSFAYEKGIFSDEISKIINFTGGKPPAQIDDTASENLKLALKRKNTGADVEVADSKISNHWIFKCDKTTSGRVFSDNIVGTSTNLFSEIVNKVQRGDTIFIWQIEERKLFGLWKATQRGYYDEFAFPEAKGKFNAIVKCERAYNLDKGIDEAVLRKLQVHFGKSNMPAYNVNLQIGKNIEEELFKANQNTTTVQETNTIPGKYLTEDGHWVRSQGETIIDNWLYQNGHIHAYEHRIQRGQVFKKSDFYLPSHDLVIEYWGLSGNDKYEASKRDKINFYKTNGVNFLELFPQDIYMISEVLKSKLSIYGIDTK